MSCDIFSAIRLSVPPRLITSLLFIPNGRRREKRCRKEARWGLPFLHPGEMLQCDLPPPRGSLTRSEDLQKVPLTTPDCYPRWWEDKGLLGSLPTGREVSRLAAKAKPRGGGLARPRPPTPAPRLRGELRRCPSTAGTKGIRAPKSLRPRSRGRCC